MIIDVIGYKHWNLCSQLGWIREIGYSTSKKVSHHFGGGILNSNMIHAAHTQKRCLVCMSLNLIHSSTLWSTAEIDF